MQGMDDGHSKSPGRDYFSGQLFWISHIKQVVMLPFFPQVDDDVEKDSVCGAYGGVVIKKHTPKHRGTLYSES